MDATLHQLLQELFESHQEIDRLREQVRHLQSEYTDIKQQLEARNAVVDPVQ